MNSCYYCLINGPGRLGAVVWTQGRLGDIPIEQKTKIFGIFYITTYWAKNTVYH